MIGNKIDLESRAVSQKRATDWCQQRNAGIPYFETSAKEAINIELAFVTIARNALSQIVEVTSPQDGVAPIRIDTTSDDEKTDGGGCGC